MTFEIRGIDPAWNCKVAIVFSSEYGDSETSEKVSFQINSMNPSKPHLSLKNVLSTSVQVEISTETNACNVLCYYLFRKQCSSGQHVMEPEPIERRENPFFYTFNDLLPSTTYDLYAVSIPINDVQDSIPTAQSNFLNVKTRAIKF